MSWNRKYWDIIEHLFWVPSYLGLRSLKPVTDPERPNEIIIARSDVPRGNSIYTRSIKAKHLSDFLETQEEILNHVLDIGLAIAPDHLISGLFCRPFGFEDLGPYESIGRECEQRYGRDLNFIQPDGFFISSKTALAVEYKLKASSSPEQLLKYASLILAEERFGGPRHHPCLLFVVPEGREDRVLASTELPKPGNEGDFLSLIERRAKTHSLSHFAKTHREELLDVLHRLEVRIMNFGHLYRRLADERSLLTGDTPAEQAYRKLLEGLLTQLRAHANTGI